MVIFICYKNPKLEVIMDFQWILLALFLVAIISGVSKALSKSMLKNTLRLGAVVLAFLITFVLQLCGVFQNVVATITGAVGLIKMIPVLGDATELVVALASTLVSPIFFIVVFFVLLWIFRIVIHFVVKGIEKKQELAAEAAEQKAAEEAPAAEETPAEEAVEEETAPETEDAEESAAEAESCEMSSDDTAELTVDAAEDSPESEEPAAEAEPVEEAPAAEEAPAEEPAKEEPVAEEPVAAIKEKPKKKKKKKHAIYPECAWKKIISLAAGAISSVLVLAVVLMPTFYLMSIVDTATGAIENTDADDSQIYKIVDVVDEHIVSPFNDSFVSGFYKTVAITDLMNYTVRAGGKVELDNGKTVYADDVLKNVIGHGVSLAAQATSAKSECPTIKADVEALISDPMISSILANVLVDVIKDAEIEEPEEGDLLGGLVYNFVSYYKDADKAVIENDLQALGGAVGVLAEQGVLAQLLSGGEIDFTEMLADEETLGDVVAAISGLSAFDTTIEGAFKLGIELLDETLQIPANDEEVYDNFREDLLDKMVKDEDVKFNIQTIRYYVTTCANNGYKVVSNNGVTGHSQFIKYVKHWEKVQTAFANASEDKSYGYFTIIIDGKTYVYDKTAKTIVVYSEANSATYKDKISPIPGLINALALNSSTKKLTPEQLDARLTAYAASASADAASLAVATKLLSRDGFTTDAVTTEKMLAATNFAAWTDETREQDSRVCVSIIMNLLGLMENLGSLDTSDGIEGATDMIDQFALLGETMDDMTKTTCIKDLPPLLLEGIVKNEMFADFMKPSIAFQINSIVAESDKTYAESMVQIGDILKWAISTLGGEIE